MNAACLPPLFAGSRNSPKKHLTRIGDLANIRQSDANFGNLMLLYSNFVGVGI
jgi:hypothetical protein